MSFFCNTDKEAEDLNIKELYQARVCNGYDELSKYSYKVLIEKHKHLTFYKKIEKRYPPKDRGSIIRWLYRGLSMEQAIQKMEKQREIRTTCVNKALAKKGK